MRNVIRINDGWLFTLDGKTETVNLPHTWNAFDGQDGTNGYLRTKATYSKELPKSDKKTFLECRGVNSKAEVRVNNELVAVHEGGYSAFRVDISDYIMEGKNEITLRVVNTVMNILEGTRNKSGLFDASITACDRYELKAE